LGKGCEQRGLTLELVDLASIDPEERLPEEVCYLACGMYRHNLSGSYCGPNRELPKIL
jgi:hypothetical protein